MEIMEIGVASQRMIRLINRIDAETAKQRAWAKKLSAFDALSKVSSLLSRPKDEDFALVYNELRYEPFWHVVTKAHYEYNRTSSYQVPVTKKEVKTVTIHDEKYTVQNRQIHIPVMEHCLQDEQEEMIVDGLSSKSAPELKAYLSAEQREVKNQLKDEVEPDAILIPPQARVWALMRDSLAKMIKRIHADEILSEDVQVERVDLYYRPIYAFKYAWASKGKEAILEVDGVTGEIRSGGRVFTEYIGKVLDRDFLFDIGADAVGMFVPGGSIAVKAAKKYMDTRK